jgi:hypothetical protein
VSDFDELLRLTARKHLEAMVVRMGLAEVGEVTEESIDRYLAWLAEPDEELSTGCGQSYPQPPHRGCGPLLSG